MTTYSPPLRDLRFVIEELVGLDRYVTLPGCEELSADLVGAILDGAGVLAADVLAPLNRVGDTVGARWDNGSVVTPPGFREAYRQLVDGAWMALRCDPEYGGQGMPHLLALAVDEMLNSANLAFALSAALNMAAVEAINHAGSAALKKIYLPRMVSGEWAGTMCLTEPQAGSDLSAIKTRALRNNDDGNANDTYRIFGQKIFITWGEHDLTDNIIHLVLAHIDGAPEGVRGISMFIVPKFLVHADGTLGERNDVACTGIEHKLGIHGSPTASLSFGDEKGAVGYLVGEENRGLEYMFVMMNLSRLNAGVQGAALGERAYQAALVYASDRVQGTAIEQRNGIRVPIVRHPDVRRLLLTIKAQVEAMRALAFSTAALIDIAARSHDAAERARSLRLAELLTPVVKGWCSETGQELCSAALQVHGGMGFIEETGIAQYYRDIRIVSIYEGTTAIQANDLVGRKLVRDNGEGIAWLLDLMCADLAKLKASSHAECQAYAHAFEPAVAQLEDAANTIRSIARSNPAAGAAVAVPFLMMFGQVCGAWKMGQAMLIAAPRLDDSVDPTFYAAKMATARFYAEHILPRTQQGYAIVSTGAASVCDYQDSWL